MYHEVWGREAECGPGMEPPAAGGITNGGGANWLEAIDCAG